MSESRQLPPPRDRARQAQCNFHMPAADLQMLKDCAGRRRTSFRAFMNALLQPALARIRAGENPLDTDAV
ncbi:MAG: hypothetical protein KF774_17855 [Planctomyces sp.]|nr:hypothetical protein [Planctomyces sp.]